MHQIPKNHNLTHKTKAYESASANSTQEPLPSYKPSPPDCLENFLPYLRSRQRNGDALAHTHTHAHAHVNAYTHTHTQTHSQHAHANAHAHAHTVGLRSR